MDIVMFHLMIDESTKLRLTEPHVESDPACRIYMSLSILPGPGAAAHVSAALDRGFYTPVAHLDWAGKDTRESLRRIMRLTNSIDAPWNTLSAPGLTPLAQNPRSSSAGDVAMAVGQSAHLAVSFGWQPLSGHD